jgi:hypothetical protein
MGNNISFRDVQFWDGVTTVGITVVTDVPCHLICRLTSVEPQIHLKSGTRRGYNMIEDLRFCFVAFSDWEQSEIGETLYHYWSIPFWPFCTTKWCYFWGYRGGYVAVSTSPPFKHHNIRSDYPPEYVQLFEEPWTDITPPPPPLAQLFIEPWDSISPTMELLFEEPWTS